MNVYSHTTLFQNHANSGQMSNANTHQLMFACLLVWGLFVVVVFFLSVTFCVIVLTRNAMQWMDKRDGK